MKQETKRIIEWIINILKADSLTPSNYAVKGYAEDIKKYNNEGIQFLNSLPEIESHLTRGGYVQDKNGTPCCDGDKVEFETILSRTEHYKGYLLWKADEYRFFIMNQSPKLNANEICMANIRYFTKVE